MSKDHHVLECFLSYHRSPMIALGEFTSVKENARLSGAGAKCVEWPCINSSGLPWLWNYEVLRHMVKSLGSVIILLGFKF